MSHKEQKANGDVLAVAMCRPGKTRHTFSYVPQGRVPVETSCDTIQRYLADLSVTTPSVCANGNGDSAGSQLPDAFADSISNDLAGVEAIARGLDPKAVGQFLDVVEQCQGQVLMSGIGKSGQLGQRFSSSLSSVGVCSHFVHASEWGHGDLGKVRAGKDVVVFVSHSGNTKESVTAAKQLVARGVTTLAVIGNKDSLLSQLCLCSLIYPHDLNEPFGCLPTTSIVIQDVILNGVISELIYRRGILEKTFRNNHPGGAIGNASLSTS